tara:strand:+ start:896 stop:1468 length:573 start_codon:yes stop_codon:yes gene_type:complete
MIITISGTPGSGKSTVAKILVNKLNAERIYVGGIRRELAKEKGMTLEELNVYAKTHPETDVDVDEKAAKDARELEKKGKLVIAEGYTMFHFIPESVKILITCTPEEGARRIWNDLQNKDTKEERNEGNIFSLEQMQRSLLDRLAKDSARYKKYYGINHLEESQYDFIIDSTNIPAIEVADKVLEFVRSKQ